jgi:NAD(P)-dependent dehydrogenase (short-subunit alcohol dehydrogenase family)
MMKRILVIGGYGGFGARLSRRLAQAGHHVLVAGRSGDKAARFAATLASAEGLTADRNADLGPLLAACRPDLAIDAAGPFQASDYRVPLACIAAGIPYLDLADARAFVTGIGALDAQARAAGVAVIAGASTAPALTGAVARHLAEGLDRVDQVEVALSASGRATAGASVARAILSYVGKPVRLWRGGRWHQGHGWQEMRKEGMAAGAFALGRRRVALIDVPDHDLLPKMLPGRPAVAFRAGNELGFQMLFLWLASWPVRWGWVKSLAGTARWLLPVQRLTAWLGNDRSGMTVTLTGRRGAEAVERRWSFVAVDGDGPEIPTLAAAMLAGDIFAGTVRAGAFDPSALLPLARFDAAFAGLALAHRIEERVLPPVLYERLMGVDFAALPPLVRSIHDIQADGGAAGEGRVERGRNPFARLMGAIARFPPAGTYPLHVAFAQRDGRERWTRDFGGHVFSSELSARRGLAVERFGPLRFAFALAPTPDGLAMHLRRWSAFGVRPPLFLAPRIMAREWEEAGRFRFDVRLFFPPIGEIVHYSGWLSPVDR